MPGQCHDFIFQFSEITDIHVIHLLLLCARCKQKRVKTEERPVLWLIKSIFCTSTGEKRESITQHRNTSQWYAPCVRLGGNQVLFELLKQMMLLQSTVEHYSRSHGCKLRFFFFLQWNSECPFSKITLRAERNTFSSLIHSPTSAQEDKGRPREVC